MHTLPSIAIFLLLSSQMHAEGPTRCFEGGSDSSFLTTETIAIGADLNTKMPQVDSDTDNNPTKLVWVPRPDDVSVEAQEVGRFQGKSIYYVIYRGKGVTPQTPKVESFECLMLSYQTSNPQGVVIRPFLVAFRDDQSSWGPPLITSKKARPFTLEIGKSFLGSGMFWDDYTFAFTRNEAHLVERRGGGRKIPTKTYRYNKTGKVVAIKTDSDG